jgi:outer membrane protein assembly factor BamB
MTMPRARRSRSTLRRRRFAVLLAVVVVVVAVVLVRSGPASSRAGSAPRNSPATPVVLGPAPAIEAGLMPWNLPTPLSRATAVPLAAGRLLVLGGLSSASSSTAAVLALDTAGGTSAVVAHLTTAAHDSAALVLAGTVGVYGGGSATVDDVAQQAPLPALRAAAGGGAPVTFTPAPALPAPRADLAGVTVAGRGFLLGGYDGTTPSAAVLSTTDGRSFHRVGQLAHPVRYPAVAALGSTVYLFGGLDVAGQPTAIVQSFDTATGRGRLLGRLPTPLAGASAGVLAGRIYVAGGADGTSDSRAIWAFDPRSGRLADAGTLPLGVAYAASTVSAGRLWLLGGEVGGVPVASVEQLRPNRAFGTAGSPGAGSPYFGDRLLVADRGNNRLLLFNTSDQLLWSYPSATRSPPPGGFYFPDDAFFVDHGRAILTNEEDQDTLVEVAFPSGRTVWTYGHPNVPGTAAGYLHQPDDAYLLKDGVVTVADALNCRILFIDQATGTPTGQIGTDGQCVHNPPTGVGYPNGDTPLADGNVLVSEIIGSWVSEYTRTGHLVWTVHLPVSYPSDPQQLGPDRYLLADYASPGGVVEFDRAGHILYRYRVTSGPGRLDHPSLAEQLPSGVIMINDDYNDRMVAIDPTTGALVWQYGVTGHPGTAAGLLNTPDGFDVLTSAGTTPTHPTTG